MSLEKPTFQTVDEIADEIRRRLRARGRRSGPGQSGEKTSESPLVAIGELDCGSNYDFVASLYNRLWKQDPDPTGIQTFVRQLDADQKTRIQVASEFHDAPRAQVLGTGIVEFLSAAESSNGARRSPSATVPAIDLGKLWYRYREFLAYSGVSFVKHVFRSLLKREPDENSLSRCLHEMESGAGSKLNVIRNLSESAEARLAGTRVWDLEARQPTLEAPASRDSVGPAPVNSQKTTYSLQELVEVPDRIFLQSLYRCVLKREPDLSGTETYTALWLSGAASSADIVYAVATSAEARALGVTVTGLRWTGLRRSLASLPLVGHVFEIGTWLLHLPQLGRNFRQVYHHNRILLEQLQTGAAADDKRTQNRITDLSLETTALFAQAERSALDQDEIRTAQESLRNSVETMRLLISALEGSRAELEEVHRALEGKANTEALAALSASVADREELRSVLEQLEKQAALLRKLDQTIERLYADKADREQTAAALSSKADLQAIEELQQQKADRQEVFTALSFKADSKLAEDIDNRKADRAAVLAQLVTKADREEVLGLLAAKADSSQVAELSEHKADRKFAEDLYHQKADQSIVSTLTEQQQSSLVALHTQKLRILDMERRLSLLLEEARKRFPAPIPQDQAEAMVQTGKGLLDGLYTEFEDIYRGTREDIKSRQAVYFPRILKHALDGRKRGLDIGCGRGEFLELLAEHGFTAKGVDVNEAMVTRCRDLGLDVEHADGIEYLKAQKSNSHSLISAFHVVEHLKHDRLIALLDEALRTLAPGGILILETPNPKNLLVGSCTFYLDPTHLNPIPDQLLQFLVEARGFVNPEVIPLHPVPEHARPQPALSPGFMNELLFGPQDYGVVAWKA